MDKAKAEKIKQKVNLAKNENEINFVQEQGKALGLAVDNMKPMELNEPVFEGEPLLLKKGGKYRIDEQYFALMFLEAFQNEDKVTGDLVPLFNRVEQMIGIPKSTLRDWWAKKEEIMSQRTTVLQQGLNYISTAMMMEMMRMTQAMATIDYSELVSGKPQDMHNFISLFNTLINKFRLMNNQSTSNVAHQHEVELVIPD
mgnify:CR=1 FL=1|jgi:hypothetical protein|tara:strand:+ start:960 stop:1556 length:597 start_codon:yes stop_codon:yes gene_type:complete